MRLRATLTLMIGLGLSGSLATRDARAQQPAPAADDPITDMARQRYNEGVKAFDAGKFDEARSLFFQAYALKRHPAVLLNIGLAELRSNHPEDAGNHLEQFLRDFSAATPDQKQSAEKGIADAKKKSGFVAITVDASGADVSVDGTVVGKSPITDPVFVKAGKHTIVAQLQGKTAAVTVDAKIGTQATANLALGIPGTPAPTPAVPIPTPTPTPTPGPTPVDGNPPVTNPMPLPGPPNGSMGSMQPDTTSSGEREPFLTWYTHHPLAIVGTGVAVLGLAGGIIFSASAGSASSQTKTDEQAIRDHVKQNPTTDPGGRPPCGSKDTSGSDLPGYGKACDALRKDISAYNTDVTLSTVGWVLLGVGAVGTVTYALVDWLPKKKSAATSLVVAPIATPTTRGLTVLGRF